VTTRFRGGRRKTSACSTGDDRRGSCAASTPSCAHRRSRLSALPLRRLLAVAALGALLAGCGTFEEDPAATVNGSEISDSELHDELDAVEDNEGYRALLEQQLGSEAAGEGEGTFATPFVSSLLSEKVYFTLIEQEVERDGVELGDERLDGARSQLEERGGQDFADLPRAQQDDLVERVALLSALDEEVGPRYFEDHKSDFDTLCVNHVLVSTDDRTDPEAQGRAEELKAGIDDGTAFRTVATEESDDAAASAQGGDLGCGSRGRFPAEFEDAAYDLDVNEVSDPVRTQFGYHLIQVRERNAAEYQDVIDSVRNRLLSRLAGDADVTVDPRYGEWRESAEQPGRWSIVPPSEQ
jgi:parvulin-like peptidyl-prolyl isomerase